MRTVKIISLNVNGIRAAVSKNLDQWVAKQQPDILCLQETRIDQGRLSAQPHLLSLAKLQGHYVSAQRPGYSGVAIFCKQPPEHIEIGCTSQIARLEGRHVRFDWPDLSVISFYMPKGEVGSPRLEIKYKVMSQLRAYLTKLKKTKKNIVLCGDLNIAHEQIDLFHWRNNQQVSGFLLEEREWMSRLLKNGWVDVARNLNPEPGMYTWWSQRGSARERNIGWRIDYQLASEQLAKCAQSIDLTAAPYFSDHAPVSITYRLED